MNNKLAKIETRTRYFVAPSSTAVADALFPLKIILYEPEAID